MILRALFLIYLWVVQPKSKARMHKLTFNYHAESRSHVRSDGLDVGTDIVVLDKFSRLSETIEGLRHDVERLLAFCKPDTPCRAQEAWVAPAAIVDYEILLEQKPYWASNYEHNAFRMSA